MLRSRKTFWRVGLIATLMVAVSLCDRRGARGDVTSEEVEHAIREGVRYLKDKQAPDGSWADVDQAARTGVTSLVTLALMTAGEKAELAKGSACPRVPEAVPSPISSTAHIP